MKKILILLLSSLISVNVLAKPTLVLIHGALLTSDVWAPVQSDLQNDGYNVITLDTPGRVKDGVSPKEATLSLAVAKLCKVLSVQVNPVLLVAHSQAGAVITQATKDCGDKIKGLVYVAAVVPMPNEKVFDLLSENDYHNFDMAAPTKNDVAIPNLSAPINELFIGSASEKDAAHAINNMVPESIIFGEGTLNYDLDKFSKTPKFYIATLFDKIISPETQGKYLNRTKFSGVFQIPSGHSPFVTHPHLLAKYLEQISSDLEM